MRYLLVLLGLMFANTAEAVIDCKTPPSCESLGYVKEEDANCIKEGYVYCPFDHNYKRCVEHDCEKLGFTKDDKTSWCSTLLKCKTNEQYTACLLAKREVVTCTGFDLTKCPDHGICSECTEIGGTKYKLAGCNANYQMSNNTCAPATCSGFALSNCPAGGVCSTCLSGTTAKYKLGGCLCGYTQSNNSCVADQCPSGYGTQYQQTSNCPNPQASGWKVVFSGMSGGQKCGQCVCELKCDWDASNQGEGKLSSLCCDGKYARCDSTCQDVKVPLHAHATKTCTGCSKEVPAMWTCDSGYKQVNNECVPACAIGDVYYADGSCGKVNDYVKDSSPKPVGVVYYISDGGVHGKVINLHDLGRGSDDLFDPANPYQTNYKYFEWGSYGKDISGLTNWTCSGSDNNYLTVAKTGNHEDAFWSAGKSYTDLIAEAQNNNLQYAAGAAHAFYPPEVSENDPKVGKGKWYLPTLGELMDLYGYNYNNLGTTCSSSTGATGTTKTTVNATLQALKNKSAGNAETLTEGYYWSSSEYDSRGSWKLYMHNGYRGYDYKYSYYYVRASLAF